METRKMLAILVLAFVLWVASMAEGAISVTVNNQPVDSVTLEVGQNCTVEVVSDDSSAYDACIGFDDGLVLGTFWHIKTMPEAGNVAVVKEAAMPYFYGYYVEAAGGAPPPSPGVHFIFEYRAGQLGETDLKLYDQTLTSVMDSVHVTVVAGEVGTGFTYQGRLLDANESAEGLYDFQFALYDAPSDGNQFASATDTNEVVVTDGYFTVTLDFGSDVYDGDAVWLEIGVRPGAESDPCEYTILSPRQQIRPAPYALALPGLRTEPNEYSPNVIGGGNSNIVTAGTMGATISGGGVSIYPNTVGGNFGTVGGGILNTAHTYGTVGGGVGNTAHEDAAVGGGRGNTADDHATVGGGEDNNANEYYATIGGGRHNEAMGRDSTIGGGNRNSASGSYATVPGGRSNTAAGDYSFAAGRRAKADHVGSFVWADWTDANFASTANNQFLVRASGGVGIGVTDPGEALDVGGNVHLSGNIDADGSIEAGSANVMVTNAAGNVRNAALEAPKSIALLQAHIEYLFDTTMEIYEFMLPAGASLLGVQVYCTNVTSIVTVDVRENGTTVLSGTVTPVAGSVASGVVSDSSLASGSSLTVWVWANATGTINDLTVTLVVLFNHES